MCVWLDFEIFQDSLVLHYLKSTLFKKKKK